jgi:glutamine amidotransferase
VIALVDYGAGNLTSVRKALRFVGAAVYTPAACEDLAGASGIILPGVGHFAATSALDAGWRVAIGGAIHAGTPFLGICLGMQWLFESSDEAPDLPGLGVLPGRITRLPDRAPDGERLKVPHVGWNRVATTAAAGVLAGVPDGEYFYFTHAFAAPITEHCAGVTEHGVRFAAMAQRGRLWGVQFHPEKSGPAGLAILRAFAAEAAGVSRSAREVTS